MSVFELALVMKVATCCLMYCGHVVPKDVGVALALTVCVRETCQNEASRVHDWKIVLMLSGSVDTPWT